MQAPKLFLIGLDAADPTLLEEWIAAGKLPTFARLMEEGAYGRLKSIPPTFSPVEWTSILTGANPGKHGIFGFTKPLENGKYLKIINSADRRCRTFYEILEEAGCRIGLLNMVMTYPAAPINGFMITGMETPDVNSPDISYPKGLVDELRANGCNYQISPGISGLMMQGQIATAVSALLKTIDIRYQALQYLLHTQRVDVMVVLFSQIDNCGHYFWHLHDPNHPNYSAEAVEQYGDVMLTLYQRHEQIVEELMAQYPDAHFIICSDHGMGYNYEARYYVKELFAQLGWYVSADSIMHGLSLKNFTLQRVKQLYWWIYKHVPMVYKQSIAHRFPAIRSRVEAIVDDVGWEQTRLYSNDDFFSISIPQVDSAGQPRFTSPEEYETFRDEIITVLQELTDVETGAPLISEVYRREDLYTGDAVADAPDVIIEWAEVRARAGIRYRNRIITPQEIHKSALHRILTGEHRPHGIILLKGEGIRKGIKIGDGSVLDVAPTMLYLADQPIPDFMDGSILSEAFSETYQAAHPKRFTDSYAYEPQPVGFDFSPQEEEIIAARLRGLGYIE